MKTLWIILFLIATGIVVVSLPDDGPRMASFNKDHGPSRIDLIGVTMIVAGWLLIVWRIIMKRKEVLVFFGSAKVILLIMFIVTGALLIIAGLRYYASDTLLWMGVSVSVLAYAVLMMPAFGLSHKSGA